LKKRKVRIVESEDSDVENVIEQTRSVSLNTSGDASTADASAAASSADDEPQRRSDFGAEEVDVTYHELARQSETVPKRRKKRQIVITDELREHIKDAGIRCQKCGVKTKTSILLLKIRGKSEGKSRSALRADCSKCGGRKFAFGKLVE
jgi:hypothetical protein